MRVPRQAAGYIAAMQRPSPRSLLAGVLAVVLALTAVGCGGTAVQSGGGGAQTERVPDDGPGPAVPGAKRHIIYLSEFSISTILERLLPQGPGPLEKAEVFRQVPARQTVMPPAYRIGRINSAALAGLTAKEMARRIEVAVNTTCTKRMRCTSHLVSIDDIGKVFRGTGGKRLDEAMAMLQKRQSPWGSTYADRVVMYVPLDMMRDLLAGGAEAAEWSHAVSAVAKGESYWLEMYVDWSRDVDYRMWTEGTKVITDAIVAAGGTRSRMHFILGAGTGPIDGMPEGTCPERVGCSWVAARANALNRSITANGVGLYRVGPRALEVICVRTVAERKSLSPAEWKTVKEACDRYLKTGEMAGSGKAAR